MRVGWVAMVVGVDLVSAAASSSSSHTTSPSSSTPAAAAAAATALAGAVRVVQVVRVAVGPAQLLAPLGLAQWRLLQVDPGGLAGGTAGLLALVLPALAPGAGHRGGAGALLAEGRGEGGRRGRDADGGGGGGTWRLDGHFRFCEDEQCKMSQNVRHRKMGKWKEHIKKDMTFNLRLLSVRSFKQLIIKWS